MVSGNPGLVLAVRRALCSAATVPVLLMSPDAPAQEQDASLEEIVVTGSRIARDPNIGGNVPVQSLSADDLQLAGNVDLGETLNRLPALLGSNTSTNSIGGIFGSGSGETDGPDVGETILQLRALGVERTLVLVNGRRHVAGVGGSQAVDIGSIPQHLIERVEVLTGGASAIYGADAVTGVINFITKDDFEGFRFDVTGGVSGEGDGENVSVSGLYGLNFHEDRGNFAIGLNYATRKSIQHGDRDWSRNNGVASDDQNPALRFQTGDIDPTATPNFARFYAPGTSFASELPPCDLFGFDYCYGFHPVGFPILSEDEFTALWREAFPGDPDPVLTEAERALVQRAASAPTRLIASQHNFSISSPGGLLLPGSVFDPGIDLDGNGVSDCQQSYQGYISTYDHSPPAFGIIGGCWIIEEGGNVRPLRDGLISNDLNQFGPDGIADNHDPDELLPDDWRATVNIMGHYDLSETVSIFAEGKYSFQETEISFPLNTFWDLLTIAPDNPYITQLPPALAAVGQAEGLFITRDPTDLGPNLDTGTRETSRFVLGFEGELENGWAWEVSTNYGRFDLEFEDRNRVIVDRWFAAIDAVDDGNGNVICRSDIDPTPPPTTPFDIPNFSPGFFTFNPGDGSCRPANILGGPGAISQEAIDFITATIVNTFHTEQFVFSGSVAGELGDFGFAADNIGFAAGAELRTERSSANFDPLVRGILPVTTAFGQEGDRLADIAPELATPDDPYNQRSLVFDSGSLIQDIDGSYDVGDVFAEISVPLLADRRFAEELTFDAAARISNYSTVGTTLTWKAGGSWTPVADTLRFRGAYAVAVRAPNVNELFSPSQAVFLRPVDPCDEAEIGALLAANDPRGPIRQANCLAAGIPPNFTDPLTARFVGETSGNPDLEEEEADTITFGLVLTPPFLDGLSLSLDYWDIQIDAAIDAPSAQSIVDSCYDSVQFPDNQYCELVRRNPDPNSPQFNGLQFIRQQQLNIGSLEAAGVDFDIRYRTDIGRFDMLVGVAGTWMEKLDRFFDPTDPSAVDPELEELQRPEWAGNLMVSLATGPLLIDYKMQYMSEQALGDVEIETVESLYGPAGMADETYVHDLAASFELNDHYRLYGGVNNIGNEKPFITEFAFPVNPIGRFFFVGLDATFQ